VLTRSWGGGFERIGNTLKGSPKSSEVRRTFVERSIKSAERTLRLLELFSRRQKRLGVSEIARGLAIPQPSASMLLANLARIGYLEYDRVDRSYAPTIRVALLGCWIGARTGGGGPSLASQFDELHRKIGEDCLVGIQNGTSAQIVYARGRNDVLSIDSGRKYSLISTAMGRALLALKPDAEVVLLVRRCNAETESRFRVSESPFLALIQEVRHNGYATSSGCLIPPGLLSIAVAVQSRTGSVPFGITFIGPIARMEAQHDVIVQRLIAFQTAAQGSEGTLRAEGEYANRVSHPPRDYGVSAKPSTEAGSTRNAPLSAASVPVRRSN
jgi:IclR family KDG regulon transcriptional repressor